MSDMFVFKFLTVEQIISIIIIIIIISSSSSSFRFILMYSSAAFVMWISIPDTYFSLMIFCAIISAEDCILL